MHRFVPPLFLLLLAQPAAAQAVEQSPVGQPPVETGPVETPEEERRAALERDLRDAQRQYRAIDDTWPIVGQTVGGVLLGSSVVLVIGYAMWGDGTWYGAEPDHTGRDWAFGAAAGICLTGIALIIASLLWRHDLHLQRTALRVRIGELRAELEVAF